MSVLAVANQKGGVAKTTTALSLAATLAKRGKRILLVDMDPQGSATAASGIEPTSVELRGPAPGEGEATLYDALLRLAVGDASATLPIQRIEFNKQVSWDLAPANIDLSAVEMEPYEDDDEMPGVRFPAHPAINPRLMLDRLLEPLRQSYDGIVIDCPPTLTVLTYMCLVAADAVLIPVVPDYISSRGLGQLIDTIRYVRRRRLNPRLTIAGVFFTRVQTSYYAEDTIAQVREFCRGQGVPALASEIPATIKVAESHDRVKPMGLGSSSADRAYRELVAELGRWFE